MKHISISLVQTAGELIGVSPDLIVLPEGTSWDEIHRVIALYTKAAVVAAVPEDGYMRGVLYRDGRNQVDYLKIGADRRLSTRCGTVTQPPPLYECGDMCIGMVVCMDVEGGTFCHMV